MQIKQKKKKTSKKKLEKALVKWRGIFFIIIIVLFLDAASCRCSKLALFHFSWEVCFSVTLFVSFVAADADVCSGARGTQLRFVWLCLLSWNFKEKNNNSYFCLEFGVRFMKTRLFRTVDLKGHHEPPLETEGLWADERVPSQQQQKSPSLMIEATAAPLRK